MDSIKFGAILAIDEGVGLHGIERSMFAQGMLIGATALATYADMIESHEAR